MDGRQAAPSRPPNPALPYREDCWSEGETSVLIDAWGDRYVELNRGNLRQKQWQEVADAVNSRPCDARRPPRTDVQCKNRIDTLKKKYKVEKSKIADGAPSSPWIFYDRLDTLIGPSSSSAPPKRSTPPQNSLVPMALPLPSHRKGFPLPTATAVRPLESSKDKIVNDLIYNSYRGNDEDDDDTDDESLSDSRSVGGLYRKRPRPLAVKESRSGEGDGVKELSKAVMKLAEVYEKVEMEKNRQMMEMERQRMEFAKSMEVQRLQMFVDSQVQMMKMKVKRAKHGDHDSDHYQ